MVINIDSIDIVNEITIINIIVMEIDAIIDIIVEITIKTINFKEIVRNSYHHLTSYPSYFTSFKHY